MSQYDETQRSGGRRRQRGENLANDEDKSNTSTILDNGALDSRRSQRKPRGVEGIKSPLEERANSDAHQKEESEDEDLDVDVKKMSVDFGESKQIMNIVREYEQDYQSSKENVNSYDENGLESSVSIKTIKQCYKVIKENMYKDEPGFDKIKMDDTIHASYKEVTAALKDLAVLKGEFFAINEMIVNKDSFMLKIALVKRARAKQLLVLNKFDIVEKAINENHATVIEVNDQFNEFEDEIFKGKIEGSAEVIEQVNQLMEEIDAQMDKMTQELITIKQDVAKLTPSNQEQINKLNKMNSDIAHVEKILETADETMDRNDQDKEKYQAKFETNSEAVENHSKLELVQMTEQTRQIVDLVQNLKDWKALYKKLKNLQDEKISVAAFDLAKAIADCKKHAESINGNRQSDLDTFIIAIQKAAKKVRDDTEVQAGRLTDFENKNLKSDIANLIPDSDFLFLNKEVTRYRGSIETTLGAKDTTLEQSVKIDKELKAEAKSGENITPEHLQIMKQNLKTLEKQTNVDVPRIKRNIDLLEAYAIKALKTKLNEDNKKSQNQISKMKRNYEDLQKEIDALNTKLGKVRGETAALKGRLDNEDLEKDNEIFHKVEDKLHECDKDINGDKAEKPETEKDNTKPPSLQARKKDIIAAINKMVNQFNENNKQIKDSNKIPKTEKEMNDLITKNKEIQDDCQDIDDKVTDGKIFAGQIDERLNLVIDPLIPEIEAKYEDKNALIDECDDLFDNCEEKLKAVEGKLDDLLASVDESLQKIESASPINNPSSDKADNKDFIDALSAQNDQAHDLRNKLEKMQDGIAEQKEKMMDIIVPLNELGDREVKKPEIAKILEELQKVAAAIAEAENDLGPLENDTKQVEEDVNDLLNKEKERKIGMVDDKLKDLERTLGELGDLKKDALDKLDEYLDLIDEAKANDAVDDPQLAGKLAQLEKEAKVIEDQIADIEDKEKDIQKKAADAKAMVDDAYANPDKFTPAQVDGIIDGVDDLQEKVDGLNDKMDKHDKDLEKRIKDLKDLLDQARAKKGNAAAMDQALGDMKDNLAKMKDALKSLPGKIANAMKTCLEMKAGSTPDESADYWEERKNIEKWIDNLKKATAEVEAVEAVFKDKEAQVREFAQQSKKCPDVKAQDKLCKEMQAAAEEIEGLANKTFDAQDLVNETIKEMDDCQIPVNRQMRANEIDQFSERLDQILDEFDDLKQADADFEGTSESEKEIKALISVIDKKLKGFVNERKDHQKYQNSPLEAYTEEDIFSDKKQPTIIKQIRDFKAKIKDTSDRLKELDELMRDLNNKLISQDMANAANLLGSKAKALRDRLKQAESELKKIADTGEKMDGNTSMNEEEEFLDALKEEMPEVFKNIEGNFDQLDKIDNLLEQVEKKKQIEDMQELKKQIDDSTTKIEQCEGLVNKLENEIIEWDAFKKLCRRDEELGEIENLLGEFNTDLDKEVQTMEGAKGKQQANLEKCKDDKEAEDLKYLIEGVDSYVVELKKLNGDVAQLQEDKDICFEEFDADLPSSVKVARNKRLHAQHAGKKGPAPTTPTNSDKPEDMYYMLAVNCKYRKRIHDLLKNLRNINQRRRDLADKYAGLKKDLAVEKKVRIHKAVKGDAIDELWCFHLNKHQLDLNVQRTGPGKYLFGTRKIMAKIINGKLVIRVGGGYMGADEFIEQYGKMEMLKMMHNQEMAEQAEHDMGSDKGSQKSGPNMARRSSALKMAQQANRRGTQMPSNVGSIADMKANLLAGVKTYEEHTSNPDAAQFNSGSRKPGSPKARGTVNLSSPSSKDFVGRAGSAGRR